MLEVFKFSAMADAARPFLEPFYTKNNFVSALTFVCEMCTSHMDMCMHMHMSLMCMCMSCAC